MNGYRTATRCRAFVAAGAAALLVSIAASSAGARVTAVRQAPKTVLEGVFTAAQADRGAQAYVQHCAACHDGADVDGPPLTGTPFIDRWREDTVGSLFDFIKTDMPQTMPGSLPDAAYLDIVAHLLHENDYPAGPQELTAERANSVLLVGPNGPQPLPSGSLVRVIGCLAQNGAGDWIMTRAAEPARVREGTEVSAAEATAAASVVPGTQTFALQNVGEGGTALPAAGHRLIVKGALTQRAGAIRIHVTAARSLAASCS